nr:hypothetical protein [Tanacetum cinerariifolium]
MDEPLSPDRMFDFPVDESELNPAYDFFAPGPLLGYAADEPMVGLIKDEIAEPIVKAEEQVIALVVDMDEDIAMFFGDDDFKDDNSERFDDEEEVLEVNEEWLMALVTPPLMQAVQPPSVYEVGGPSTTAAEGQSYPLPTPRLPVPPSVIEDLSTRLGNLEYGHEQLVQKVIQVHVMASEMAHATDRFEEIGTWVALHQRDSLIQQLQTMVLEMSSRESTLMQCITRMDIRLTDLKRRPPGPQWVEVEMISIEVESENGEDFSYIRCVLLMMYQLVVVEKASFPEMECSELWPPNYVLDVSYVLCAFEWQLFFATAGASLNETGRAISVLILDIDEYFALDGGYSSKNYVRKFLRALLPKWRVNVTAIKESNDLTSLSLDELIGNLKVHKMISIKILKLQSKNKSSDEESLTFRSEDKEYAMVVRDFNKFFKRRCRECPKTSRDNNQSEFVGGSWRDSREEDDEKAKDETCLMSQATSEVHFESSYFSDETLQ